MTPLIRIPLLLCDRNDSIMMYHRVCICVACTPEGVDVDAKGFIHKTQIPCDSGRLVCKGAFELHDSTEPLVVRVGSIIFKNEINYFTTDQNTGKFVMKIKYARCNLK